MIDFSLPPTGVWTGTLDNAPLSRSQELAAELEELGYGAVWLPEVAGRDVMVHMGALLAATERLVTATGIANIWARDAITMTGGVKALTEAWPERVLLGLGVSHHTLVEGLRGHSYEKPLTAMRTYLDAMDKSPYTAARPTTPVRRVLAALGPKMLELAATRTDGAHTYLVPPEHTVRAREALGSGPLLCAEQAVVLETDPDEARRVARTHTKTYLRLPNYRNNLLRLGYTEEDLDAEDTTGNDAVVDAIVAWGDLDNIADRLRAQFDAGADHVCAQVIVEDARAIPEEEWRRLAPVLTEVAKAAS